MPDRPFDPSVCAGHRIHVFAPLPFWGKGPAETCYNVCAPWRAEGAVVGIYTTLATRADPAGVLRPALPRGVPGSITGRLAGSAFWMRHLTRGAEARAAAAVRPGDLCHVWPGTSIAAIEAARDRGGVIVLEFINTHVAEARRILQDESARLGAPAFDAITDDDIGHEQARLALADAVFAPGPFVGPSIRAAFGDGVRILETSYGAHLPRTPRPPRRPGPVRFLFVGTAGLRKGVPVLLESWRRAGLPAELCLVGAVDPWMTAQVARAPQPSVRFAGFVDGVAQLYADADVFVFPSLEEGGPQVTYEAAAHGLPLIVTPMGGGRIARDGHNALIVPPSDADALAAALTTLAQDADLRARFGAQAALDARDYAWDRVSRSRLAMLAAV